MQQFEIGNYGPEKSVEHDSRVILIRRTVDCDELWRFVRTRTIKNKHFSPGTR